MWVNNYVSKPLRKGHYKTLVDVDGFGNLEEIDNQLFNGNDWDVYESNSQFIQYWWASKEDYEIISDIVEKEVDEYYKQLDEASKNFGGL